MIAKKYLAIGGLIIAIFILASLSSQTQTIQSLTIWDDEIGEKVTIERQGISKSPLSFMSIFFEPSLTSGSVVGVGTNVKVRFLFEPSAQYTDSLIDNMLDANCYFKFEKMKMSYAPPGLIGKSVSDAITLNDLRPRHSGAIGWTQTITLGLEGTWTFKIEMPNTVNCARIPSGISSSKATYTNGRYTVKLPYGLNTGSFTQTVNLVAERPIDCVPYKRRQRRDTIGNGVQEWWEEKVCPSGVLKDWWVTNCNSGYVPKSLYDKNPDSYCSVSFVSLVADGKTSCIKPDCDDDTIVIIPPEDGDDTDDTPIPEDADNAGDCSEYACSDGSNIIKSTNMLTGEVSCSCKTGIIVDSQTGDPIRPDKPDDDEDEEVPDIPDCECKSDGDCELLNPLALSTECIDCFCHSGYTDPDNPDNPSTDCAFTGYCPEGTYCNDDTGKCITSSTHCRITGCPPALDCNDDTGKCEEGGKGFLDQIFEAIMNIFGPILAFILFGLLFLAIIWIVYKTIAKGWVAGRKEHRLGHDMGFTAILIVVIILIAILALFLTFFWDSIMAWLSF